MAVMLKSPLVIETDADLIRVGRENAGYRFERDEDGTIIVSPTCSNGGAKVRRHSVSSATMRKLPRARRSIRIPASRSDPACEFSAPLRLG
jgi:hypothetical protein